MFEQPAGLVLNLEEIRSDLRSHGIELSAEMALGLGAGLYFEYFNQPGHSPSHYFTGHNRKLARELASRAARFVAGAKPQVIREALHANAEAMDLDRSNYTAIMGMELLAEDFENWDNAPDARECAAYGAREIQANASLYRGHYLGFLREAASFVPDTLSLVPLLVEIAAEWDALARILVRIARGDDGHTYAGAARLIRRIAMLEEHFWGEIINRTEWRKF